MKNLKILLGLLLISSYSYAQPPTGNPPTNPNNVSITSGSAWYRGGNNPVGLAGTNNIFGTMWNSPIYTYTNGINRTRLNGTLTTLINGVNQNVDGYFGIGRNGYFANNTPRTLFHLQGPDNSTFGAGGGWRRWMSTGMYVSENSDAMYVGMKPVPGSVNRSNAIINWSDDPWSGATSGVDKLSFVFTQANNGNGTGTSPINAASLDGYEFMMMASSTNYFNSSGTGEGTIGVGPVFTDAAPPQSRLHINAEESLNNWLQLTNQLGTGQTASDGLRFGINGDNNANVNGNALMYNQENRHLLFSTNNNTNFVNIASGITLERMRITAIAAPTSLASGGYGVNNPAGLNGNLTRVAISHDPQSPVTRPLSLLHLGYNTGAVGGGTTDGWRNWMDIGTFTSNGTDNMYIGLKTETGGLPNTDRQDAIINWGDNDGTNPLNGPDNLRFIFTSTQTSSIPANAPGTSANGLEVARMVPGVASTLASPNFGMMGIGDWTTAYNIIPANVIDAKLDIDGDLRIRTVTKRDSLMQVLVIDSNDHNRVHWRSMASLGNVTANNGVSVDATTGAVQLGVPCQDSLGNNNITEITANAFTEDRVVAIGDFNLWFATYAGDKGGVGIGGQPASTPFCGTGNTLEISANGTSKYGAASSSGLRFNHLTSDSLTVPVGTNGVVNTKVLTVDNDGDVVLVDAIGGTGGLNCWDLNGNGIQDFPAEDVNGDFVIDVLDCQGAIGLTGPQGPIGLTGATGATGLQGPIGLTGATGPAGPIGLTGATGPTGPAGTNGIDGINGATGPQGPIGLTGPQGPPGPAGGAGAFNGTSIDGVTGNVQLGNDLGLTAAQLINDREIPMNGFNTYFSGQGFNTDAMYIGYPTSTLVPVASKFSVIENVGNVNLTTFAGHFRNINIGTGTATEIIGVAGISDAPQAMVAGITNIGGYFNAENAPFNTGVLARSSGSGFRNIGVDCAASGSSNYNIGVHAMATGNAFYNYGVTGEASGASITNRAGYFNGDLEYTGALIFSDKMFKTNVEAIKSATDILKKLKPSTYKMDVTNYPQFNFQDRKQYGFIAQEVEFVLPELAHESYMPSKVDSLGNVISPAVSYKSLNYNAFIPITVQAVNELSSKLDNATLSDQNVKTNVQNLTNSLDKVKQMRGVTYEWSSSAQNDMNLDSLQHIGFIAQEIAAIEPLLTFTDDSSLVHVNYDRVAPLLVESIKELDAKNHVLDSINNDLENRLAYLENCIRNANICTEGNKTTNTEPGNTTNYKSIELTNNSSIILDQNLPNPFAENTVINYNIPAEVSEAKLLFYDLNGRIIKELIIDERGESKLTVYGENLQSGVYTYSLIADGKLIATKKMVKK